VPRFFQKTSKKNQKNLYNIKQQSVRIPILEINMSKIIAIDLGTSNSVVCANVGGVKTVIPNDLGSNTTPSAVAFKKDGEKLVGQVAKRQQITNYQNTFTSFKRLMGHTYKEVKDEKSSYKIKANDKGLAVTECPLLDKDFTPEELSGFVLGYLKKCAEDYLGEEVTDAIITVPAYFNQDQRVATQNAGKICGLNVLRTINEPTAAALAYGSNSKTDGLVLVYDLGGGTFDVTLLELSSDDDFYQVLASSGDSRLGGDDFDQKIMDWVIQEFKKDHGVDLSKDPSALQRVRDAAEKAKCELSSQVTSNINIPYITSVDNQPVHLSLDLSRNKFESIISDLLERIKKPVLDVLSNTEKSKIKEILLVGGSTRVPCVVKLIEDMIGITASKGVNPDLAVAEGACELAKTLEGSGSIVLADVTSLSFGIETNGGLHHILVPKNSTIPTSKKEVFTTAVDGQDSVDIVIATGERSLTKDNKVLGTFRLSDIPHARRGVPQIEVELNVNSSGVLEVKAKDLGTGKSNSITISGSSSLSQEEIDKMIQEAEEYKQADEDAKALILSRNELEMLCNGSEQTIESAKEKADQELLDAVSDAVAKAREILKEGSKEELDTAKSNLLTVSHKLSEVLYQSDPPVNIEETAEAV
jgi:molecular chaperone DnaK